MKPPLDRRPAATRLRGTIANTVVASAVWTPSARGRLLRILGVKIARGARVYPGICFVGRIDLLTVGAGSFLNVRATIGSNAPVTIGTNVAVGPGVQLLPTTHELGPSGRRAGANRAAAVSIGDGVWIGAGATILSGVTVGAGAVIAAGAVVTSDCEPDCLYGGTPARKLRTLGDD